MGDGANTYLIGDFHWGHESVARRRGFASADEHDLALYDQCMKQLRTKDHLIVVGDISSGKTEDHALEIIASLPGTKELVTGNHDSVSAIHVNGPRNQRKFLDVFQSVTEYRRIRSRRRSVLVSHYPYASQGDGPGRGEGRYMQFRLPDLGALLIHAHTHHTHPTSGSVTGRELCVSWDAWNRLVSQGDVDRWVKSLEPTEANTKEEVEA